jgi:hypothetical protein
MASVLGHCQGVRLPVKVGPRRELAAWGLPYTLADGAGQILRWIERP